MVFYVVLKSWQSVNQMNPGSEIVGAGLVPALYRWLFVSLPRDNVVRHVKPAEKTVDDRPQH